MARLAHGLFVLAVALCAPLLAQATLADGDVIPRSGTLMYMVSDRPDALYRLFGQDAKGNWRLRAMVQGQLDHEFASGKEAEQAKRAQAVFDHIFGAYESLDKVEVGLVDVTLDGPKYLAHLCPKEGKKLDTQPELLKEFLTRTVEYRGRKYVLYRTDNKAPEQPEEKRANPDDKPAPPGNAKPKGPGMSGMSRYYVADMGTGVLVANFETTIREGIDRYLDADRSESLSGREEFKEWRAARGKHDLSVFVVGREVQNLVERLLPSKEQAGVDAEMIYNQVDSWIQFREYKYVVFDFDYEASGRAVTMAATLKTKRPTKLLERFAIEPAKFTAMRYVPSGAVVTVGLQLGDAKKTFDNLVEFARDMQKIGAELERGGLIPWGERPGPKPPDGPPEPKKATADTPPPPEEKKAPSDANNPWLPRSVGPLGALNDLADALKEQAAARTPGAEAEKDVIEKALKQLDEALAGFGTTRDEVLAVIGSQAVFFMGVDAERAKADYRGNFSDVLKTLNFGVIIALKDPKKAQEIVARAREKDPEGVFKGMIAVDHEGVTLNVSPQRMYGYAFSGDVLLVAAAPGYHGDDPSAPVTAGLKAMLAASKKPERTGFAAEGSKVLELNWGELARIEQEAVAASARRLDRYARPPLDKSVNSWLKDFTIAIRTREQKDGIEIAMRIGGLPDLGSMFDDVLQPLFEGGGADRDAYSYSNENLRAVGNAMRKQAEAGTAVDLDALIKAGDLRTGALQTPFDSRWKGTREKLGWINLEQVKRDEKGNLPYWVDKAAAEAIEANEKAGYRSFKLAEGNIAEQVSNYAAGMIVLYQEKAETLGGHLVLYADGQAGWLHGETLKAALKLNAEGKPVPAEDRWRANDAKSAPTTPEGKGDNPWLPGDKDAGTPPKSAEGKKPE